jgi:Mg-chelatase subunit ChlD
MGPVKLFDSSALATADINSLTALSENSAAASGLEGLALAGSREGDGTSSVAATEFFGIGGYGQTFVYVVDASGSMSENGKFDRARYELLQSIEQLASDQRYFVVFYNDEAHPMDGGEPVLATQNEIAKTVRWVNSAYADGGTNPLPALLYALSLRPDAIYFLSDGQFEPVTAAQVRNSNRRRNRRSLKQVPIHTIAFVDRMTIPLMRTIAEHSGGEFRFVE